MLPTSHVRNWQEFKQLVEQLQGVVALEELDRVLFRSKVDRVEQFFRSCMIDVNSDQLDPSVVSQLQAYQTEVHKQLRLLGMDAMFLQAAYQSITAQERQRQMEARLQTLISYCEAVLRDN